MSCCMYFGWSSFLKYCFGYAFKEFRSYFRFGVKKTEQVFSFDFSWVVPPPIIELIKFLLSGLLSENLQGGEPKSLR